MADPTDFLTVCVTGKEVGACREEVYFVEQDWCERPQLESARISYQYLSRLDLWGG